MTGPALLKIIAVAVVVLLAVAWTKRHQRAVDLQLVDQIEGLAISIAMALILKFFIIEAFQIPTGSMQPTIIGNRDVNVHDRVLVDKLITMLREPQRWDVTVFRYPLAETASYIKRLVGLPGETLEIRGGDIWIDGEISRKPDSVNESVLKTVFPTRSGSDGVDVGAHFVGEGEVEIRGTVAAFTGEGGRLLLRDSVRAEYLHGYDPDWGIPGGPGGREAVPDLELAFDVTPAAGTEAVEVLFLDDERALSVTLPTAGEAPRSAEVAVDAPSGGRAVHEQPVDGLATGRASRVVARDVDRQIVVFVDGEEWLRWRDPAGPRPAVPRVARAGVAIRGPGQVADVQVRRDIFYTAKSVTGTARWEIPDDSYFMLGDNTQHSLDSREWQVRRYELADGRELRGFWFPPPPGGRAPPDANPKWLPGRRVAFMDVHGDVHEFAMSQIIDESLEAAPFVHRRYILGKAVAVFWPVFRPFRWKLIR